MRTQSQAPEINRRNQRRPNLVWMLPLLICLALCLVYHLIPQKAINREPLVKTVSKILPNTRFSEKSSAQVEAVSLDDSVAEGFEDFKRRLSLMNNDEDRETEINAYLNSITQVDVWMLLNYLSTATPIDLSTDLKHRLAQLWASKDPSSVANWYAVSSTAKDTLDDLAIEWANENPTNAVNWAKSLSDSDRIKAVSDIANELVRTDPVQSLTLAVELQPGIDRDELVKRGAMEWATQDPKEAVIWAEKISDENLRTKVLASESVALAKQNPLDAAELAVTQLPNGRLQEDTIVAIVERWAQQSPATAAQWVEQFPSGMMRDAAIENLYKIWSLQNSDSAQLWKNNLTGNR